MPLYQQLFILLKNRIQSGEIEPGTMLPGEQELSADFGVSRITCKRALNELADAGLVSRQRGLGTTVLERPRPPMVRASIEGWLENVSVMGKTTRAKVLSFDYLPATQTVADALEVPVGTSVQRAVRVRWLAKDPMSYLVTYVPEGLGRRYSREDMGDRALLRLLEDAGVTVASAWQSISATLAEPEVASALAVPAGSPLIDLHRVVRDAEARPVEFIQALYRPDRYRFEMTMRRVEGEDGKTWSSETSRPAAGQGTA